MRAAVTHRDGSTTVIDDSCALTGEALEKHLKRCGIRRKESNETGNQ